VHHPREAIVAPERKQREKKNHISSKKVLTLLKLIFSSCRICNQFLFILGNAMLDSPLVCDLTPLFSVGQIQLVELCLGACCWLWASWAVSSAGLLC
jgi:hypothetical protein